jgi:hypothetical protein
MTVSLRAKFEIQNRAKIKYRMICYGIELIVGSKVTRALYALTC